MNYTIIERAIQYIAKMPAAISGQGGHNAALNVANKLYEFGLSETEAFQVFHDEYNPRCQPPWSDGEIRHKISEAFTKPLNEHGSKLGDKANIPTGDASITQNKQQACC